MFEGSDELAQWGLSWIYDRVEERFGVLAAWLVTVGLAVGLFGALIALLIWIL
jgi:hypothetical protein